MGWLAAVLKAIPLVVTLMCVVEDLFDDEPDSGAQKKEYVMTAIKAVIDMVAGVTFTPELWEKIEKAIGKFIDIACIFLFPHEDVK